MLANILVIFYRWWHGRLKLIGAGFLVTRVASFLPSLQRFPLTVPGVGVIKIDFRDSAAFEWLQYSHGERCQEYGLLVAMSQYCHPDGVLWDIGANMGLISAHFADPKYRLKAIHAFEPNPDMFSVFQSLFRNNPTVHGHNIALSSKKARKELHVPVGGSLFGSFVRSHLHHDKITTFSVDCYTADELVDDHRIPPPSVVKIDVEGHEMEVLRGMKRIIEKYKPVVFLEHLFIEGRDLDFFEDYSVMTISDENGTLHPGFEVSRGHNIVLIPK